MCRSVKHSGLSLPILPIVRDLTVHTHADTDDSVLVCVGARSLGHLSAQPQT